MSQSPYRPSPNPQIEKDPAEAKFSWWVRMLAVMHVLSQPLGWLAFVVLNVIGVMRWIVMRESDVWMVVLLVGGLAAPFLGAVYRWWFVQWGRRNWPDGKPK